MIDGGTATTRLSSTGLVDDVFTGGGHVGLYRATSGTATTLVWDDFKCGVDQNSDGDVDDSGTDYIWADYNFDSASWKTLTFTHDANGNLSGDGLFKYKYDVWNRLVGVWYDGGDTAVSGQRVARYEYDGLFRRVEKELSNQGDGIVYGSNPAGLNLYAVDGTWADWNEGTNTEWIYRLTREKKRYWNGPNDGVTGLDSPGICEGVFDRICEDVRAAAQRCENPPSINLVGWSRGAAIITWVSHRLAIEGCCTKYAWWGGCRQRVKPEVDWLGLFDAVDMSPAIPDWAMVEPPNVRHISHAVKTAADMYSRYEFPTAEIAPWTYFWRHDGTPTTHGDIGTNLVNNDAFYWMREQARLAGLTIN